eukprot:COSAG01_NODE_6_length_54687_cov_500.907599_31_plen_151_part_00
MLNKIKAFLKLGSSSKSGFTLIEMLVVVGIIGVLVAILMPRYSAIREKGHEKAAIANGKRIAAAFEVMYDDGGTYESIEANFGSVDTSSLEDYMSGGDGYLINPYYGVAYDGTEDNDGQIVISSVDTSYSLIVYGRGGATAALKLATFEN